MLLRSSLPFCVSAVVGVLFASAAQAACPTGSGAGIDLETANTPIQLIIPTAAPKILQTVSPGDATLVLRFTTLLTGAWFDATAPYHPTAVGVYSSLDRQDEDERTDENRNIAALYASQVMLDSLFPDARAEWDAMLCAAGLDPADSETDLDTPVGIGKAAGAAWVSARERDGMNQLGDEGGRLYNLLPYADYTGYRPWNTAYRLWNPRLWQPDVVTAGNGIFSVQQFVTPQLALTDPISYDAPTIKAPPPLKSYAVTWSGRPLSAYVAQADEVLKASADLTDRQKMVAELFDDKIASLGFSAVEEAVARGLSLQEFIELDFLVNVAAFDTAITIWENKRRYDAVRPFSAIRYLYGSKTVTAWGGPGQGTVSNILGTEWRSYLQTANHPEYPSATASFCQAHAVSATRYLGDNEIKAYSVTYPAGSSRVEPSVTPASDLTLTWDTWDDFSDDCGVSRLWAGVHFFDSIPAGQAIGEEIGEGAYDFVMRHIEGDVD